MILPANKSHIEQIVNLWSAAFGDSTSDVKRYLKTLLEYFLVYEEDGIVKGMMSVLPVCMKKKKGGYIYAVTTHKSYRGQGICSKMMEYVKREEKYEFLVLKPQNRGLFEFYEKMDFTSVSLLAKKDFEVSFDTDTQYTLKKVTSKEYEKIRNTHFTDGIIKWDSKILSFAESMYDGTFYTVEYAGKKVGFAFVCCEGETAVIKELVAENPECIADFIGRELRCKKVKVSFKSYVADPTFMVYPQNYTDYYFNIYFD